MAFLDKVKKLFKKEEVYTGIGAVEPLQEGHELVLGEEEITDFPIQSTFNEDDMTIVVDEEEE